MKSKSKRRKSRKGGPNPGAFPRKNLIDFSLKRGHLTKARHRAEDGDFSADILDVGYAIAALKEYERRTSDPHPYFNAPGGIGDALMIMAYYWPESMRSAAQEDADLIMRRAQQLVANWLVNSTKLSRKSLNLFLESRPLFPNPRRGGALWPRPADPVAYIALQVAVERTREMDPLPPSEKPTWVVRDWAKIQDQLLRLPAHVFEEEIAKVAPGTRAATVRRAIGEILEMRRNSGTPRRKSS